MNFNKKDSVADAVHSVLHQEALKGDQKKIDKNHNNKIDAGDFKILRGEKKVEEEIDVKDRTVDTINGRIKTDKNDDVGPNGNFKSTKVRFHGGPDNKSADETAGAAADANKENLNKTRLRMGEEAEQIDEKNWIAGAIKKPGAMTAAANREGESTSEYIKKHEHDSGKSGKRARLAKTLKSFKEANEEHSIYDQMIQEVLSKDASAGDWIHDFVHSDNPKFKGKSMAQRKKQALAAYYAKQRNEETEQIDEKLVGNQTKIDKNHNNKIDAQDFKILRGQKKANEEVEQIDEAVKTKTAYVPYVYTDKHGSGFGGYDVHYSKEDEAHAHVAKHGHIDNNGKKGWVEKHELAKHPHTGGWVEANHLRRHGLAEDAEQVKENSPFDWKKPREPEVKGGAGVKKGRAYGGAAQKSKPEQDETEDKKKVTESKRPEDDSVPFAPPYNTTSAPVTDKSGATHTPMSRAKHLARLAMKRVKTDLGKKGE